MNVLLVTHDQYTAFLYTLLEAALRHSTNYESVSVDQSLLSTMCLFLLLMRQDALVVLLLTSIPKDPCRQ